ncbi:GAF domain-containing sensor histidine kinase [Croceibacterium xixiisoli]|uniref:GAF domain-containing sensor histidine kinase n=1 Tax=Croceibacterium xixiisoli TaxID=1476466 RepID=UPI00136FA177|nr:GAF domain-containing sensor histidine kinase [Croceibacterium xixiisoli]
MDAVRQVEAVTAILEVVTSSTGMGFAAVARVTDRAWMACEVLDKIEFGLKPGGQLPLETTLCNEVRFAREEIVIDEVASDPLYATHHTPATYGFQSYISVPIVLSDGKLFGTLCAIDPHPRRLKGTPAIRMFRLFAELIGFHLDANRSISRSKAELAASEAALASTEAALITTKSQIRSSHASLARSEAKFAGSQQQLDEALATGQLREEFIAVLGHDLRNPLASMAAGINLLTKNEADPKRSLILRHMNENARRMGALINNLLDFARGRLGGGIDLALTSDAPIGPQLEQILEEIRMAHPDRVVQVEFDVDQPIAVDQARIAQMFSNLMGNAITHGSDSEPITVTASVKAGSFELEVANGGEPISPETMKNLFQPFRRGQISANQEGLGLGLYIASEIAKAHAGTLTVSSDNTATRFTFRMPV